MCHLGLPKKYNHACTHPCVHKSKCNAKFGDAISEDYEVMTWFRQSDTLFPALLNTALESVVRETLVTTNEIKIEIDKQTILTAYADDLVIRAENKTSIKYSTLNLWNYGKIIGLTIHGKKKKYIIVTME